jgi:hypothetical protein
MCLPIKAEKLGQNSSHSCNSRGVSILGDPRRSVNFENEDGDFLFGVSIRTAVDPRVEVLDMLFDDYLCKPVDREEM